MEWTPMYIRERAEYITGHQVSADEFNGWLNRFTMQGDNNTDGILQLIDWGEEQDNRLTNIETKNSQQDIRLTDIETKNNQQDIRLANVETKNTHQDNILNNKVDKIPGKGLSTNDYTDSDKSKLTSLNVEAYLTEGIPVGQIALNNQNYNFYAPMSDRSLQSDWTEGNMNSQAYIKNKFNVGDGLQMIDNRLRHSNSVTAQSSQALRKVAYDAQGHITGSSVVTKADITNLGIPAIDTKYTAGTGLSLSDTQFSVNVSYLINLIHPVGDIVIRTDNINPGTLYPGTTWQKVSEGRMLIGANSTYTLGTTGGSANAIIPSHTHNVSGIVANNGNHTHSVNGTTAKNGEHNHKYLPVGSVDWEADYFRAMIYQKDEGVGRRQFATSSDSGYYTWSSAKDDSYTLYNSDHTTNNAYHDHTFSANTSQNGQHNHSFNVTSGSTGSSATGANMPPYLAVNIWQRIA